jgi:uncharacterized protein HemY
VEPLLGLAKAGLSMVSKSNLTAKFNCVIGQLRLMSGQYQAAQDSFKAALTALPDYVLALQGKIECNVYQNIESDASIILEDVEKLSKIPQSGKL